MFKRYDNEESRFARLLDKVAGNTETSLQKLNNALEILQDSPFGAIFGFYIAFDSRKSYVKQYYGIDGTELILIWIEGKNRQIKYRPEIPLDDYMSIFKSSRTFRWEKQKSRKRRRTHKAYGVIVKETAALRNLVGYMSPPACLGEIEKQLNRAASPELNKAYLAN